MSEAVAIQSVGRPAGTVSQTGGAAPGRRLPKAAGEGHRGKGPQVVDAAAVTGEAEGSAERGARNAEEGTAEEPLTTERLQASLLEQFRGATSAAANAPGEGTRPTEGEGEETGPEAGDDSEPSLASAEGTGASALPSEENEDGGGAVDQSQKGLIDAVTALRAERRELRAELEGLKGKFEAIAAQKEKDAGEVPADAPGAGALPGNQTDAALFDAEVQEVLAQEQGQRELVGWARHQLRTLDKNPDGVVAELKRRRIELPSEDPEVVKDWLEGVHENGRAKLDELIVERRAVLNVARQRNSELSSATGKIAEQILPEKKDAGSDRAKLYEHVMKNNPGLKSVADGEMRAALQVLGIEQAMAVIAAGGGDAVAVMKLGHLKLKSKTPGGAPGAAPGAGALPGKKTVVHRAPTTRLPGAPVNVAGNGGAGEEPSSDQLYQRYVKEPTDGNKMAWMRSTLRKK